MKIGALFSGGKDSTLALLKAIQEGHEPVCLITIESENPESYMFHVPNIHITKLQAEAMNLPIIYRKSRGQKEKELKDLKAAIKEAIDKYKIEGVTSGALFSRYQANRIEDICKELGIKSITPLWMRAPEEIWPELFKNKFKVIISAVAADGLGEEWLGKELGEKEFEQLKNLHNTCYVCTGGEGGEFESLVIGSPLFNGKEIKILEAERVMTGEWSGYYNIKKAKLK